MRVLHVIPSMTLAAGGPPVVATNIARALIALGAETEIFTTSAFNFSHRSRELDDPPPGLSDVEVRVFPLTTLSRLAHSPELAKAIRESAPTFDVFHIHMLFQYPQFAAFRTARRNNIPYVVSPHGALDPFLRQRGVVRKRAVDWLWQREMMDNASAIHYTTSEERDLVHDLRYRAPSRVIANGVDVEAFMQKPSFDEVTSLRLRLGLKEGPIVLNHGRLDRKKGLPILVEAFSQIREQIPSAQLVLAGPDSRGHRAELEQLVRERQLQDAVSFVGMRLGAELTGLIHMADVWILPSHSENFGYAVVEAMAAGRAVITSPQVNIAAEAYQSRALSMVPNVPTAVADAAVRLLNSPILCAGLGARAQAFAQRYNWLSIGNEYFDLYNSVRR